MIKYFVSFTIFVFFASNFLKAEEQDCAFCNQQVVDNQKFYEESLVMALYSYKPIFPGHVLIIPKRHVERYESLTDEEILQMGQVVKKVHRAVMKVFATSAYLLLQKNGKKIVRNKKKMEKRWGKLCLMFTYTISHEKQVKIPP